MATVSKEEIEQMKAMLGVGQGSGGDSMDKMTRRAMEEQNSRETVARARKKIAAIMGDDTAVGSMMRKDPSQGGFTMADLMEGLDMNSNPGVDAALDNWGQEVTTQLRQQNYMGEPDEARMLVEEMHRTPRPTGGDWKVVKNMATLKSGAQVPVWMVQNKTTTMEIKKPFRLQEAAQRIAAVLNHSGNMNDPRVKGIMEAYDRHVELMKQIRGLKKMINEGQTDKRGKLQALQGQLEAVNLKLGI